MPLPSEQSLRRVTRVLSIAAAVGVGALAGWFCFANRDAELAKTEWNPIHLYFRLVTGESVEDVAARSLEQPAIEPVFAYDREAFGVDPELLRNFHGPMVDPDLFSWNEQ